MIKKTALTLSLLFTCTYSFFVAASLPDAPHIDAEFSSENYQRRGQPQPEVVFIHHGNLGNENPAINAPILAQVSASTLGQAIASNLLARQNPEINRSKNKIVFELKQAKLSLKLQLYLENLNKITEKREPLIQEILKTLRAEQKQQKINSILAKPEASELINTSDSSLVNQEEENNDYEEHPEEQDGPESTPEQIMLATSFAFLQDPLNKYEKGRHFQAFNNLSQFVLSMQKKF